MPNDLSSFQSAIQLVSGANLAIFALPKLGQERLDIEARRWEDAVGAIRAKPAGDLSDAHIAASAAAAEFRRLRDALAEGNGNIRQWALGISIVSAIYLVWMSIFPNHPPGPVTGAIIEAGWIPGLVLLGRDGDARKLFREFSAKRSRL